MSSVRTLRRSANKPLLPRFLVPRTRIGRSFLIPDNGPDSDWGGLNGPPLEKDKSTVQDGSDDDDDDTDEDNESNHAAEKDRDGVHDAAEEESAQERGCGMDDKGKRAMLTMLPTSAHEIHRGIDNDGEENDVDEESVEGASYVICTKTKCNDILDLCKEAEEKGLHSGIAPYLVTVNLQRKAERSVERENTQVSVGGDLSEIPSMECVVDATRDGVPTPSHLRLSDEPWVDICRPSRMLWTFRLGR